MQVWDAEAISGASMNVAFHKRRLRILLIPLLLRCIPLHGIDRDRKLNELHHTAWTFYGVSIFITAGLS